MRGGRRAAPSAPAFADRPSKPIVLTLLGCALLCAPSAWAADTDDTAPDDTDTRDATGDTADDSNDDTDDDTDDKEVSDTVTVEDTADSADTHDSPAAATIVRIDPSTLPPSTSVADVLEDVSGVAIRRFGGPGDPAFVRIRGSTAQQVAVYVDGVPLNAHGSGAVDLSELDVAAYEQVEVYRSAAPAELGAAPIGGVVHLRTRPDVAAPLRVSAAYGSWGTHSLSGGGGIARELPGGAVGNLRFSAALDGTRGDFRVFDPGPLLYSTDDDAIVRRANNHLTQLDTTTTARLVVHALDLTLRDRLLVRQGGVPGPVRRPAQQARLGVTDNLLAGRAQLRFGRVDVTGDLSWRVRADRYVDREDEVGLGVQDRRDLLHEGGAALGASIRPTPGVSVLPSARLDVHAWAPASLLPGATPESARLRFGSTFGLATPLARGPIALTPTVRLIVLDDRLSDHDAGRIRVEPLPQVALAIRPAEWLTIRAASSRSFRPPSFLELFGDRGGIIGNASLVPETALSTDAGLRLQRAGDRVGGSFEIGGFLTETRDAIVFVPNGQRTAVPINLGRTLAGGIEAAASFDLLDHLHVDASLSWTRARITAGERGTVGNAVPGVPELQVHATVEGFWDPWIRVGYRVDFTAGTYDSASNFYLQAPRPLHSAHLRVQLGSRLPWLSLEVRNLGDQIAALQARDPLHPDPDDRTLQPIEDFRGNPLPGRSLHVAIGWTP